MGSPHTFLLVPFFGGKTPRIYKDHLHLHLTRLQSNRAEEPRLLVNERYYTRIITRVTALLASEDDVDREVKLAARVIDKSRGAR